MYDEVFYLPFKTMTQIQIYKKRTARFQNILFKKLKAFTPADFLFVIIRLTVYLKGFLSQKFI